MVARRKTDLMSLSDLLLRKCDAEQWLLEVLKYFRFVGARKERRKILIQTTPKDAEEERGVRWWQGQEEGKIT